MGFILKILFTALAVFVADYILDSVHINDDIKTTIIVALVLALLNTFVRPVLVLLTIPITIVTLGLFLLIINIIIVKLADYFIDDFRVDGWLAALIFSLIVSVVTFILDKMFSPDKKKDRKRLRF
jgi:putative membrane protein